MIMIKTPTTIHVEVERLEITDEKEDTAVLAIFQNGGFIQRPIKDRMSKALLELLLGRVYNARGYIAIEFVQRPCTLDPKWTVFTTWAGIGAQPSHLGMGGTLTRNLTEEEGGHNA